jgi:multidrug resistance efflux pump
VHRAVTRRDLARADKQLLRAPFDGVLAARTFDVGDFVNTGAVLARVVDGERLVRFALPTTEHAYVRSGDEVRVQAQDSIDIVPAAIVGVDPEIDAAAGVGFVRARIPARAVHGTRFAPGNRVTVFLNMGEPR